MLRTPGSVTLKSDRRSPLSEISEQLVMRAMAHALSEAMKERASEHRCDQNIVEGDIRLSDLVLKLSDVLLDGKIGLWHIPGQ